MGLFLGSKESFLIDLQSSSPQHWKKIVCIPDANHGVCSPLDVLKLSPLPYNKIDGF
jgi:hypothetical protein